MKSQDILSILVIAALGVGISVWLVNMILGNPDDEVVKYKVIKNPITNELASPDANIFNINAINPTVEVYVGNCEDLNGDGELSETELYECNQIDSGK